jgi:ribosomal protein S18 acetylase RimI-like enzyme
MNNHIIPFGQVTKEMVFEIVHEIDPRCFPDTKNDFDLAFELFEKNMQSLCVLYDGKKIAGYIEMYPLAEMARDEVVRGVFDAENITPEHIEAYRVGLSPVTLYVHALAVHPDYNNMIAFKHLISKAAMYALKIKDDGFIVDEVLAYIINKKLGYILSKKGFKQKYKSEKGFTIFSLPADNIHHLV